MRKLVILGLVLSVLGSAAFAQGGVIKRLLGLGGGRAQAQQDVAVPANVVTQTIRVGGLTRTYYTYRPANAPAQAPLVVAFHGGGQDAMRFAQGVDLFGMADHYGFMLAMPEGEQRSWNAQAIVPQGYAMTKGIDDVGFVHAMLQQLAATGQIDGRHIYAMGVSEGGMMAYDAACNLPGQFDAIGVVAGTLASGTCAAPQGVSLLHIHGSNDERVPFNGGQGAFTSKNANWFSAYQGIMTFAQGAQCSANWTTSRLTSDTTCYTTGCPGSDQVEYCVVQGGGHTWPGVATTGRQERQGAMSTMTFSATDMIAQFFLAH